MPRSHTSIIAFVILWMACCSSDANNVALNPIVEVEIPKTTGGTAEVTQVTVSGEDNQFSFSVTISSPDVGCNQYANWWEVLDMEGNLLYRRILAHSHVTEQPFTRVGGPVAISENIEVYIRAHMNTTSYGSQAFKGSVAVGFTSENLDVEYAKDLEEVAPLPARCDF